MMFYIKTHTFSANETNFLKFVLPVWHFSRDKSYDAHVLSEYVYRLNIPMLDFLIIFVNIFLEPKRSLEC